MSHPYIKEGAVSVHAGSNLVGKIHANNGEDQAEGSSDASPRSKNTIFYNPAQVFNRDLSLLVAKVFARHRINAVYDKFDQASSKFYIGKEVEGLTFCEPLAATCLRSLRYAKELPPSLHKYGVAGDLSPAAVEGGRANAALNNVTSEKLKIVLADANDLMFSGKFITGDRTWDVVDLDPYGTVAPFIDSGIRAVASNGLLCVTSTDMPILGGNSPEVAFYKYGGNTVKSCSLHELSLRLVIHTVQMAAARIRRYAQPILSCSVDFYVRIWFRIHDQPKQCSTIGLQTGIIHQCSQCDWFATSPFGSTSLLTKNTERNKKRRVGRRGESVEQGNEETRAEANEENIADANYESAELPHRGEDNSHLTQANLYPGFSSEIPSHKFVLGKLTSELTNGSKCPECEGRIHLAGPAYLGPLQDYDFVRELLSELPSGAHSSSNPMMASDDVEDLPVSTTADVGASVSAKDRPIETGTESNQKPTNGALAQSPLNTEMEAEDHIHSTDIPHKSNEVAPGKSSAITFATQSEAIAWVDKRRKQFNADCKLQSICLSPKTLPKIRGMLTAMLDEEPVSTSPMFYKLSSICTKAHLSLIKADRFRSALLNMGYKVGLFHREPQSIKTDAPAAVVFSIIRKWIQNEVEAKGLNTSRVPKRFLRPIEADIPPINFEYSQLLSKPKGPRFIANPEAHWGPGRKAGM